MAAAAGPVLPPKAQQIAIPDEPSIVVSEPRIPTPAPPRRAAPEARPMIAPRPVEVTEDDDYVPRPQGGSKKGIVIGAVAFAALIVVVAGVKVAMKGGDSGAPANAPTVAATTPAAPPDTTTAAAPTPPEPTPPPDEKPADPKPSDKPKKVAAADPVAPPPPAALPPQPPAARDPKPAGKTDSGKKSPKAGGGSIVRDVPF